MTTKATMKGGGYRGKGPTTMKGGGNTSGGPTTMKTTGKGRAPRAPQYGGGKRR